MTIDEAIKYEEKIAQYHENPIDNGEWHYCNKPYGEKHRQIAEFLKDYKRLKQIRREQND